MFVFVSVCLSVPFPCNLCQRSKSQEVKVLLMQLVKAKVPGGQVCIGANFLRLRSWEIEVISLLLSAHVERCSGLPFMGFLKTQFQTEH